MSERLGLPQNQRESAPTDPNADIDTMKLAELEALIASLEQTILTNKISDPGFAAELTTRKECAEKALPDRIRAAIATIERSVATSTDSAWTEKQMASERARLEAKLKMLS